MGYSQKGFALVKMKKHRFYRSILKNNDPLIFSIGFDKFQSVPTFCTRDKHDQYNVKKYTPLYDYIYCIMYTNYAPNNTGVVMLQSIEEVQGKFRVSATGVIVGFSQNYDVKKKLKLIGTPYEIHKNTAFITGMFTSDLELSKFINAKIKTVSGIRG